MLDGVYASNEERTLTFHRTRGLTALDVEEVLAAVEPRIARRLRARGLGDDDVAAGGIDAWSDEAPVLAGLAAASVQGKAAMLTEDIRRTDTGRLASAIAAVQSSAECGASSSA